MNEHDGFPGLPPDLEERFFRRQREEVMRRIETHESRRRVRRIALPLAASLAACAVLVGGLALRSRAVPAPPVDWVFAWELPAQTSGVDPTAGYSPDWTGSTLDVAQAEPGDGLLPPLFDDVVTESPDDNGAGPAGPALLQQGGQRGSRT